MNSALFDLAFGLLLGFSLTIPPGPMNAFIVAHSVRSFRSGATAGLGAMSADLVLGGLVYALRSAFDLSAEVRWVFLLGAAVMVYFGVGLLRPPKELPSSEVARVRTYTNALALGLSNPFQILWWLTAGLAFAYFGGWVLFIGLFGAIAVWIVVFPWVVHLGAGRRPRLGRALVLGSAVLMFGFAGYFLFLAL